MKTSDELRTLLRSIDHKGYPAYKSLAGEWEFPSYRLSIDHVQGDPFAAPSSLHVRLSHSVTKLPECYLAKNCMRIALQDFLTRQLASQFEHYNFKAKGSGKSGLLSISRCGQRVLERSACQLTKDSLILRFHAGFPASGRTIRAGELEKILFDFLPVCIERSCIYSRLDKRAVEEAVFLAEDQEEIRRLLKQEGLVAFVANDSLLPRKSGVSQLPLTEGIPFTAPASLEKTLNLPHKGAITGMGIPKGVTLIVGGGYHGKSTLLGAIQEGVYNHIAGDGREYVITDASAVKLRAEDGRSIRQVDISMFINDLPNHKDTKSFSTEDASGSTSQAAGVVEAIEAGAGLFLMDEDTSATNFMVRDALMQQVIQRKKEPITPFIERVRQLYETGDISTILVAGSSGAFFYIADHILQMDCYHTTDITKQVKELCAAQPRMDSDVPPFSMPEHHRLLPAFHPTGRYDHMKLRTNGLDSISLDKETVDTRYLEQLIDPEQTTALAYLMRYCLEEMPDRGCTISEAVSHAYRIFEQEGWKRFCHPYIPCGLAKPRIQELFQCINRFRG